jgi:hypothetical protein
MGRRNSDNRQLAGGDMTAGPPPDWASALEAKFGLPLERIPGTVYVLHYEVPQLVRSVSRDYAGGAGQLGPKGLHSANPLRHYVGWSSQADPRKRIYDHGPAALREIVYLEPDTMNDEAELKVIGRCPKCGERYADDLVPEARRAGVLRLLKQMHEATGEDAQRLRELSRRSRARREAAMPMPSACDRARTALDQAYLAG